MKNRLSTGLLGILYGVLLIAIPQVIAPLCGPMEDGGWMKCHYTGSAEIGVGLVAIVLGVLLLVFKDAAVRIGLSVGVVLNAVLAILLPAVHIGGCKMPEMSCRAHTFPALYIVSAIAIVGFVINLIYLYLSNKEA